LLYTQEEVRQMMSLTWGDSLLLIYYKIYNSGEPQWEENLSKKLKKDFALTPIVVRCSFQRLARTHSQYRRSFLLKRKKCKKCLLRYNNIGSTILQMNWLKSQPIKRKRKTWLHSR
jgi:hypothetical protein